MKLRDYQTSAVEAVFEAWQKFKRVLVVPHPWKVGVKRMKPRSNTTYARVQALVMRMQSKLTKLLKLSDAI